MKLARVFAAFALCIVSAACAGSNPATASLSPDSGSALLVMLVEPNSNDVTIGVSRYNPDAGDLDSNFFNGWATFEAPESREARYLVRRAEPGTYVFMDVTQQISWAVCFHADSQAFDVRAGEVLYLGRFDAQPHITQIHRLASQNRHLTAGQQTRHHYFDGVTAPTLTPPREDERASVSAFLTQSAPGVSAPLRLAAYEPATFGTGRDLYGMQRLCGGYCTRGTREGAAN